MDNSLKKQLMSVIKGIVLVDVVVLLIIFILSRFINSENSNAILVQISKFNTATVLGILLGSAVSMFNFYILTLTTEKLVSKSGSGSRAGFAGGYLFRFLLCAVALIIGAKANSVSMLTVAIGLLSSQAVIMIQKAVSIFIRKEA